MSTTNIISNADRKAAFIHDSAARGWPLTEADIARIVVDGSTVEFDGTTVWMVTESEAKSAGVDLYDADAFPFNGKVWLTFPV